MHTIKATADSNLIDLSQRRFQASCDVANQFFDVEAEHIANVLNSVKGNKTRAAQILGINRKTLGVKMRRANLPTEIG